MKTLLIFSFSYAACINQGDKQWNADSMPEQVKEASQEINKVFGYDVISYDDNNKRIELNVYNADNLKSFDSNHFDALGITYYFKEDRYQISLSNEMTNAESIGVIFHELGHALGIAHSNDVNDIMYPYASNTLYNETMAKQLKKHCDTDAQCDMLFIKSINVRYFEGKQP